MSTIKFTSKQPTFQLNDELESVVQAPFVEPDAILVNFQSKILSIAFSMYVNTTKGKKKIQNSSNTLVFDKNHLISTVMHNDIETEVTEAMADGWNYNVSQITWGKPSYEKALNFFVITANGLEFKEGVGKQLAVDYILNNVRINGGQVLGDYFELDNN